MELPVELLQNLKGLPGFEKDAFEAVHRSGEQVVSIRINPAKFKPDFFDNLPAATPVPWNKNGFYLKERPSFTLDPLFHAGAYYVQEASSMFLEEALRQLCPLHLPLKALDLCAAPGGKSTLIYSLLNEDSLLVSNEVINTRVGILEENLVKWGAVNSIVTKNDPRDFGKLNNFFDLIVVDAPCSGSGLFRKEQEAIKEWSVLNVGLCAERQQRILANVLPALRPGGILIYSTCSYSKEENEVIAKWLVDEFSMECRRLQLDPEWKITETGSDGNIFGYRFYPHLLKGEGFFLTAFSKPGESDPQKLFSRIKWQPLATKEKQLVEGYISRTDSVFHYPDSSVLSYLSPALRESMDLLSKSLYLRRAGLRAGELVRDEFIPDHELAMSTLLDPNVSCEEVEKSAALDFLRKNPIELRNGKKGWCLIKFQGLALGWVKALTGRVNNYYPKSWRILNK